MKLSARSLKVTLVLDAVELAKAPDPVGQRTQIQIRIADTDRMVVADIASKSIRKCQTTIKAHPAGEVALICQGKMGPNNEIVEAGLVAQPKVKKAAA